MRALGVCLLAMLPASACREVTESYHAPTRVAIGFPSATAPIGPLLFNLTRTRLIRMDPSGHARPSVVERWNVSSDRRRWSLFVRPGVRLHDGREATAQDVADVLKLALAGEDVDPGLWQVQEVSVVGRHELRIQLQEPTSLLLDALSVVSALPTGPYRPESPDGDVPAFHAVEGSAAGTAAIDRVQVRRYDTPRAAVAALLRRDIDVLYEVPSEARTLLLQEEGVRTYPYVKPYVVTFGLNHRHAALARRPVRLALNLAIDRAGLIADEMDGFGIPAADPIWREHWVGPHAADAEAMRMDRQRAERLLDDAGLPERPRPDGSRAPRLRLRTLVVDDAAMARVAARLKRTYAAMGIELVLESASAPELLVRLRSGDFETFLSPLVTGYGLSLPYLYFSKHDRPRVVDHGYRGAERAAAAVRAAATDEAFAQAVMELHRVLIDDLPAVYLFWQQAERAVGPRVSVPVDVEGDVLAALPRWTTRPVGGS